jgi:hypothetical protein
MHWLAWDILKQPKKDGGLGFRDPHTFNFGYARKTRVSAKGKVLFQWECFAKCYTCIHLRVKGSHIYMYKRERIYKEHPEEIQ